MEKKRFCNACGREIWTECEEYLTVRKTWGYFSRKDQKMYQFHLCEVCFDSMTEHFQIPAEMMEQTELL